MRYPQLHGPHERVCGCIAYTKGNNEVRESVSPKSEDNIEAWDTQFPTRRATPKRGSLYPHLDGPHQSVRVHFRKSRANNEEWESVSPTQGSGGKRGGWYP